MHNHVDDNIIDTMDRFRFSPNFILPDRVFLRLGGGLDFRLLPIISCRGFVDYHSHPDAGDSCSFISLLSLRVLFFSKVWMQRKGSRECVLRERSIRELGAFFPNLASGEL